MSTSHLLRSIFYTPCKGIIVATHGAGTLTEVDLRWDLTLQSVCARGLWYQVALEQVGQGNKT